MDKYKILAKKLNNIIQYIDTMKIKDIDTKDYLVEYQSSIKNIVKYVDNRTLRDSRGALLGLIRGISDYSELCADRKLKQLICDAEDYYRYDCYKF